MKKIRWGILGCGKIANKFASDLKLVKDAELAAIASRDAVKGAEFKASYGVPVLYSSYEEMVQGDKVDIIYIATPHGLHFEHAMLCLEYRKAVLCEKALALNYRQVQTMISKAREKKVFLMEAFWTKFLPQYEKVMALIDDGQIGEIKIIQADFGFFASEPRAQRLYDPALGGGSLLDIGIYPVFLAQSILGKPLEVKALMSPYSSGVDEQCVVTMRFSGNALGVLSSTFAADTPVEAMIAGTKGRIHMRNRFHNAVGTLEIVRGKETPQTIEVLQEEGFGYQFEARHAGDCLSKGWTESPVMTHDHSLQLMETLDRIRQDCGIHYPQD